MYQSDIVSFLKKQGVGSVNTHSGTLVNVLDPQPETLLLEDIVWGLSHQNRYLGQTDEPYSVGQHCVLIAEVVYLETKDPSLALAGLLHDAPETWLGDIIRPFKHLMTDYAVLEGIMDQALCPIFGLTTDMFKAVKPWDIRIVGDEMRDLLPRSPQPDVEPLGITIEPWAPRKTRARYMEMYNQLVELR